MQRSNSHNFSCKLIVFMLRVFIIMGAIGFDNLLFAKCKMPIPDMWTETSNRNVAGYFKSMTDAELILYSVDENKEVKINIKNVNTIYSAAGGDGRIGELKMGVQMRIWYVECRKPKKNPPKAAYIEILSTDPLEPIDMKYLRHSGR